MDYCSLTGTNPHAISEGSMNATDEVSLDDEEMEYLSLFMGEDGLERLEL